MALLGQEILKDEPGQEVVLDRLLDLLLCRDGRLPRGARPPVHRTGGRTAHDVPRRLATGLAADLLRASDATIGAIARQVGYGSSFALSTAFTRVRGISPRQYRLGTAAS